MTANDNSEPASGPEGDRLVYMRFHPIWAYIDGVRDFCSFFCATTFSEDAAERVRLVIQESLENAIKYSSNPKECDVELSIHSNGEDVSVSVWNDSDPEHAANLLREIDRLSSMDPEKAFLTAIERAATLPDGASRLGLARMRYEGGAELQARWETDGRLKFTAKPTISGGRLGSRKDQ